jgi:hypothetical protein
MKTKRFFLFGLPVVLLALGLVLAGCGGDDDGGDSDSGGGGGGGGGGGNNGPTATISLANTGTNEFTLTLTGATWKENGTDEGKYNYTENGSLLISSVDTSFRCLSYGSGLDMGWTTRTVTRTSDTVLTIAVTKNAANNETGTTTLTLLDDSQWATPNALGNTRGARFLYSWTKEGVYDVDSNKYSGTLTVASGSYITVSITIK